MKSRVLKFRGWDADSQQFIYLNLNAWAAVLPPVVMWQQYTGLKDRNGIEIYEGDIVDYEEVGKGYVTWNNAGFLIRFAADITPAMETDATQFEVIGNIWENPGMLQL